jgi:hypothetical protein
MHSRYLKRSRLFGCISATARNRAGRFCYTGDMARDRSVVEQSAHNRQVTRSIRVPAPKSPEIIHGYRVLRRECDTRFMIELGRSIERFQIVADANGVTVSGLSPTMDLASCEALRKVLGEAFLEHRKWVVEACRGE